MKNIAIFGASRSGKSTLSRMIAKKYPQYQIFVGDDIRGAFQHILPQNKINSRGGRYARRLSKVFSILIL